MIDILICKKTSKKIPKSDPECPVPTGPCKYRAECLIYAFEQIERMDKPRMKGSKFNIKTRKLIDNKKGNEEKRFRH